MPHDGGGEEDPGTWWQKKEKCKAWKLGWQEQEEGQCG